MNRENMEAEIEYLRDKIGMWNIVLNGFSRASFQIGYYFDCNDDLWKVYMNYDRGINVIRLETNSEEEALAELLSIIHCRAETHSYVNQQMLN